MDNYKKLIMTLLISTCFLFSACKAEFEAVKILPEKQVINQIESESKVLSLTEEELRKYENYLVTKHEEVLQSLTPMEVFKFYYHAYKSEDYETMYDFYVKEDANEKVSLESFLESVENKNIAALVMLKRLEYNIESLTQVKYDDTTSYIQVNFKSNYDFIKNREWNFKLIKNSHDIWEMEWLPMKQTSP